MAKVLLVIINSNDTAPRQSRHQVKLRDMTGWQVEDGEKLQGARAQYTQQAQGKSLKSPTLSLQT